MSNTNPYESPNIERYESMKVEPLSRPGSSGATFTLSGCLTVADAIAAHRLATRGPRHRPLVVIAIMVAFSIAVFSVILIALSISFRPYGPQASNAFLLTAFVLVALLAIPIVREIRGRIRMRAFARRQFGLFAPTETVFTAEKIVSASDNAKSEFEWPLFSSFRANETVALLFFADSKNHLILARSKLPVLDEWPSFLALIESKLGDT